MKLIVAVACVLAIVHSATACSCIQETLKDKVNRATDVVRVKLLKRLPDVAGPGGEFGIGAGSVRWIGVVRKKFKGCLKKGDLIIVRTADNSAACGVTGLSKRNSWLIVSNRDEHCCEDTVAVYDINSCGGSTLFPSLTTGNKQMLQSTASDNVCTPCESSQPDSVDSDSIVSSAVCTHNGVEYKPGDSFDAGDGCNTCGCSENGLVFCTRIFCPPQPKCPFGKPLTDNSGDELFCGRGGQSCPQGATCSIEPADRFAVCCCGANADYTECGTACPLTCGNYGSQPFACTLQCVPRCQCRPGYIEDSDGNCVKPRDC